MSETYSLDLEAVGDEELEALYGSTGDDDLVLRVVREMERRERRERRQAARAAEEAEWYLAAHAQYLQAEAECRGYLLSRAGLAAGTDPESLWTGPAHLAERYASEELLAFWQRTPRLTLTRFREQARAARREERERHLTRYCTECGWDFGHLTSQQTCAAPRACARRKAAGDPSLGRREN